MCVRIVANAIERDSNSLENSSAQCRLKYRSPNVWRKAFVLIFRGPTISSAGKNTMDQAVKRLRLYAEMSLRVETFLERLIRSYKKLCERAANVCKMF